MPSAFLVWYTPNRKWMCPQGTNLLRESDGRSQSLELCMWVCSFEPRFSSTCNRPLPSVCGTFCYRSTLRFHITWTDSRTSMVSQSAAAFPGNCCKCTFAGPRPAESEASGVGPAIPHSEDDGCTMEGFCLLHCWVACLHPVSPRSKCSMKTKSICLRGIKFLNYFIRDFPREMYKWFRDYLVEPILPISD